MSADLPSIRFPLPVVALPPLPESTVEPMPPGDDPRLDNAFIGVSPSDWYMYSALQNSDSYPSGFFSWESSDVHMGDIIVPSSAPPVNYPEAKEEDHARGWIMVCFTCPSTPDRGEPDRNRTTGYPFCDERMLSVAPLVSYATLEEPDLEVPISNISDAESIMACTVEINLNAAVTTAPTRLTGLYALSSQFFIANRTLRGSESEYPGTRYRYNETFPNGVPDDQVKIPGDSIDVEGSFSFPTPTSTRELHWWETASATDYGHSGGTSFPSLFKDDADDSGSKTGVIIGTVVPVFVLIALATFLCKWRTRRDPLTKASPAPILRNLDPAADARRLAGLPERRYISRRNFIRAEEAAARSIGNRTEFLDERGNHNRSDITIQNDPEDLPPAYHKVVTNQERIEIEQRMHAEGAAPQGWPPSYRDARSADSTPISRPVPATIVPTQSRDLYPALPSSPTR